MTRFARAKGSKSSNERVPHEATPWHVLKEQLITTLKKEQEPQTKTKSAKELLNEKDHYYATSLGNLNNDWAEFENIKSNINSVKNSKVEKKSANKKKKLKETVKKSIETKYIEEESCATYNEKEDFSKFSEKKGKRKKENKEESCILDFNVNKAKDKKQKRKTEIAESKSEEGQSKLKKTKQEDNKIIKETDISDSNKSKNKKNKEKIKLKSEIKTEKNKNIQDEQSQNGIENKIYKHNKWNNNSNNQGKHNQKNPNKRKEYQNINTDTFNVHGSDWNNSIISEQKIISNHNKDKQIPYNCISKELKEKPHDNIQFRHFRRFGNNVPRKFLIKTAKIRDDKKHNRRKPIKNEMKFIINGLEVEIATYDGFPVKKEDAQRLTELRKEMVLKGIPKSEIDMAMKLERRKCEKALARIRKQVCFHCRRAGHNLSDCPELAKEETGTGICFKCGSTEHTHYECKVNKSDDYKYAKCFICREQGHIAKQCPDNPKGLYPDGGSCKICGDVTHLKKDCPDLMKAKEDEAITLETIKDENIELLENKSTENKTSVKSVKVVNF